MHIYLLSRAYANVRSEKQFNARGLLYGPSEALDKYRWYEESATNSFVLVLGFTPDFGCTI